VRTRVQAGGSGASMEDGLCSICAEVMKRTTNNLFHDLLGPNVGTSYILDESEHFIVMPSVGALVPGYILIVPKVHFFSFVQIPATWHREASSLLSSWTARLEAAYGVRPFVFEHGMASALDRAGSCCDHAHLHVVPAPEQVDLFRFFQGQFEPHPVSSLETWLETADAGRPYLILQGRNREVLVTEADRVVGQLFRRELARQLELGDTWDWVVFPYSTNIQRTIATLSR
jgi:diadenosine tetraphosphate (Ap4A) HIT family hydrolase